MLPCLLALDTSTDALAVALCTPAGRWHVNEVGGAQASARLIPALMGLLQTAGIGLRAACLRAVIRRATQNGQGRTAKANERGHHMQRPQPRPRQQHRRQQHDAQRPRDLGQFDARGYLSIVGRGKDLIISGGLNIYPKEVEEEIDALSGVMESAVIGLPHSDFGEGVVAVIVRDKGMMIDEDTVMAGLNGRLARFKLPKKVIFVDELPRNTMGKVQKNLLRDQYKDMKFNAKGMD